MYWYRLSLLVCLAGLLSCSSETKFAEGEVPPEAFDLKAFFEDEIERLSQEGNCNLKQRMMIDGAEESINTTNPNWANLLQPFINSDINKEAWLENYRLKEEVLDDGRKTQIYTSVSSKMKTQRLGITFSAGGKEIGEIAIANEDSNFILSSSELLRYTKNERSFSIDKKQQYFFFPTQEIFLSSKCE